MRGRAFFSSFLVLALMAFLGGIAGAQLTLPYTGSVSTHLPAFKVTNTGTGGAAHFLIRNPTTASVALYVNTNSAQGAAGAFQIENATSPHASLEATTTGTGPAGRFSIINATNKTPALEVNTRGEGPAGRFVIMNTASKGASLLAITHGPGVALSVETRGTGWAASFLGMGSTSKGIYIKAAAGQPGLQVASGTKSAVVATSKGARALYTEEATEVWFTDYGFGRLEKGIARIPIESLFAETVRLDKPYHVFIQTYGNAELYVSQRTPSGFEVRLRGGEPDVEFSYRLVAKRRGYERTRLEHAPWADEEMKPELHARTVAPSPKADER